MQARYDASSSANMAHVGGMRTKAMQKPHTHKNLAIQICIVQTLNSYVNNEFTFAEWIFGDTLINARVLSIRVCDR